MTFVRRPEDFTCSRCGTENAGDGYTNHCRACLWSRHVDTTPGSRDSTCGGLMEPVSALLVRGGFVLCHACTRCGAVRRNRSSPDDDTDAIRVLFGEPFVDPLPAADKG